MHPDKIRIKLTSDLNLQQEPQDWGIVNADEKRVVEFIKYYYRNNNQPLYIKYDLIELIIASYNNFLVLEMNDKKTHSAFSDFITKLLSEIDRKTYDPLKYWLDIQSEDEFPVGRVISAILMHHTQC